MREIPLTRGKVALVDDEDYEWLMQWKWHAWTGGVGLTWYATRSQNRQRFSMQAEVLRKHGLWVEGLVCDHVDRDGLNNQKSNLRMGTHRQNCMNQVQKRRAGFKGVSRNSGCVKRPWRAVICLGSFATDIEAARAYDKAAKYLVGEFAYLNFPDTDEEVKS